jgi:AcrR family transcriptional regulator
MSETRDALLAAAVDTVVQRGLADLSLRTLADEIGTSHRMLIYHFGSKEGLVTEVVKEIDRRLFAAAWPEAAAKADDPAAASRAVWHEVSSDRRRAEQVLMVEMYVAAMRGHPGTGDLSARLGDWAAASESQAGWLGDDAHRQSRLLAAVVRGLLIDLLMTGEHDGVEDAFERFLELAALDPRMP